MTDFPCTRQRLKLCFAWYCKYKNFKKYYLAVILLHLYLGRHRVIKGIICQTAKELKIRALSLCQSDALTNYRVTRGIKLESYQDFIFIEWEAKVIIFAVTQESGGLSCMQALHLPHHSQAQRASVCGSLLPFFAPLSLSCGWPSYTCKITI